MKNTDENKSLLEQVGEVIGFGAMFGALVISLGWSYARAWFEKWKMPFSSLELDSVDLLQYGRIVIGENVYLPALCIIATVTIYWILYKYLYKYTFFIVLFSAFAAWYWAGLLGEETANVHFERNRRDNFQKLPMVELSLKDEDKFPSFFKEMTAPRKELCYRLIFVGKDAIWLAQTKDNDSDPTVAMIARDDISLMRLYPARSNCK